MNDHKKQQKYDAILFDLDGTLIDSVPTILQASQMVYDKMGLPFKKEQARALIGIPLREQADMIAGSRAEEFVLTYRQIYRDLPDSELFEHARETLECLRDSGYRLGVVTSKMCKSAMRTIEALQIADFFECIVTADDVTMPKPHPEPLLIAMNGMQLDPARTLFVGDSIFDIECGHAAGVDLAAVSWGSGTQDELLAGKPRLFFTNWEDFTHTFCHKHN